MRYQHYIGLDIHKTNSFFVVLDGHGAVEQRVKVRTCESELLGVVRSIRGSKGLAFEETALSQWTYLLLRDEVSELVICNPAVRGRKLGAKSDFRDAAELGELLRLNGLKGVYHGADARMELRTLISGYGDVVSEVVRAKNRLMALFGLTAQPTAGLKVYTNREALKRLPTVPQRFVASQLFDQLQWLAAQKEAYTQKFQSNLRKFPEMRLISSIPGFGPVHTNQVVGVVVTPYRFSDKYHFYSYARLVSHLQISDGVVYGKRRAHGNTILKGVFQTAVFSTLKGNNAFHRKYEQMIADGANPRTARGAIARKLAATVLGVWKSGKKYHDHYEEVNRKKIISQAA